MKVAPAVRVTGEWLSKKLELTPKSIQGKLPESDSNLPAEFWCLIGLGSDGGGRWGGRRRGKGSRRKR